MELKIRHTIMKKIIFFSALLFSMTVSAFETSKPSKQLVMAYIVTAKYEDITNATISEYEANLSPDLTQEQRTTIQNVFNKTMSWSAIKDQLVDLISQTYTKEELEAYILFAKSPAGITFSNKSTAFTKDYANIVIQNQIKLTQEPTVQK